MMSKRLNIFLELNSGVSSEQVCHVVIIIVAVLEIALAQAMHLTHGRTSCVGD